MSQEPHSSLLQFHHIFENHSCSDYRASDGFSHIQAHVSTNAFDSDQHFKAAKCHPKTRIIILREIMTWITLKTTRIHWILWLNGAAGGGKSAIARSIVELCLKKKIPIARFFFCGTDSTRNNTKLLVATIVHQIMQQIPEFNALLIPKIGDDPIIFEKSLRTQFEKLIFDPLRQLAEQNIFQDILVLLFDGTDECIDKEEQTNLIRTISTFMGREGFHVITFFGSRNEPQLNSVFTSNNISKMLLEKELDHKYSPNDDILLFLRDSFVKITETHQLRHLLQASWPTQDDVDRIACNSSGQFAYASCVMKFISDSNCNPAEQVQILRRPRPSEGLNPGPFAEVDAIYQSIFSQIKKRDLVIDILAWILITKGPDDAFGHGWKACALLFKVEPDTIHTALIGLASVISTSEERVEFLHASLPDFLRDEDRAKSFFVDIKSKSTCFALRLLTVLQDPSSDINGTLAQVMITDLCYLLKSAEITPALKKSISSFHQCAYSLCDHITWLLYTGVLKDLNLDDELPQGALPERAGREVEQEEGTLQRGAEIRPKAGRIALSQEAGGREEPERSADKNISTNQETSTFTSIFLESLRRVARSMRSIMLYFSSFLTSTSDS